MIYSKRLLSGLALGSSCLVALALSPETLEFRVAEGLNLTKSFKSTSQAFLEGMTLEVDGNDVGAMIGEIEVESEASTELIFSDSYDAIDAGRITKLTRSFEALNNATEISIGTQFGAESQEIGVQSALDGRTVIFLWDAENEKYSTRFEGDEELDEQLLRYLDFETDMRFLLPPTERGELEVGDSWEVPLVLFKELILPGGDLAWQAEDVPDVDMEAFGDLGEEIKQRAEEILLGALKGAATCTFVGVEDLEGVSLAGIQVAFDFELDLDLLPMVEEFMETILDNLPMELPLELGFESLSLALSLKSEGLAHWNLKAGHLADMLLHSDADFSIELSVSMDMEGESHSLEMSMEMFMDMDNEVLFSE